jgi:hypothetical protein
MPAPVSPESRIAFHTLYESPLIGVHDYRCTLEQGGPAAEEESGEDNIVLMRHGAFCKHFEGRSGWFSLFNQGISGSTDYGPLTKLCHTKISN